MNRILLTLLLVLLTACGPNTLSPEQTSTPELLAQYKTLPTSSLWSRHLLTQSARELAVIEAELASRGQTSSGSRYIGQRTAGAVGKTRYARTSAGASDRNCSDFANGASAQKFLLSAGGPSSDPHGLDRDGDGFACEWGTTVRQIARSSRVVVRTPRRPRYSSTCYTGPRGGTYTITASGNKNYSGC